MERTEKQIAELLAAHAEKSKGVSLDINGVEATYQEGSQIKPPEIPWWARLHLRAYGIEVKPEPASLVEEKPHE